jgi:hypothetical protein
VFINTQALNRGKVRHVVRHGLLACIGELRWTNPPF